MSEQDFNPIAGRPQSLGAAVLAESAVSRVSGQQMIAAGGARQFILDHLVKAILSKGEFSPDYMLDELRGHRLPVDAVIDIYVPAAARRLGEMWMQNEASFAAVTIGTMRLQSLLSLASAESLEMLRPFSSNLHALIVVPECEQHTLGAFVLAAQLRRLGVRVDMSFCEVPSDAMTRTISAPMDTILFTASSRRTLEFIADFALDLTRMVHQRPLLVVGGGVAEMADTVMDACKVDLVTNSARDAVTRAAEHKRKMSDQASR